MPVAIHPSHFGLPGNQKIGTIQARSGIIQGIPGKTFRLQQYNPKKILEFPLLRVVSVHRIVMGGEG